jgi:PKD repeat protein
MVRSLRTPITSIAAALSFGMLSLAANAQTGGGDPTIPDPQAWIRLGLTSADGVLADEATVHLGVGTPGDDPLDIPKIDDVDQMPIYIATLATDNTPLAFNAHGAYAEELVLLVQFMAVNADVYTLNVMDLGTLVGRACVSLEDLETGERIVLSEGLELPIEIPAGTPTGPRYKLHVFLPAKINVSDAICPHGSLGSAFASGSGYGPWKVTWFNYEDLEIAEQTSDVSPIGQGGLYPGNWTAVVEGLDGCGTFILPFVVNAPEEIAVEAVSQPASCADATDGSIALAVSGGEAPYTFAWSNGSTGQDLEAVPAGTYLVNVADANGCNTSFTGLTVQAPEPIAGEILAPESTGRFQPVQFSATSPAVVQRSWDFGDGSTSIDLAPQHAYQNLGLFTVRLTLTEGACQTVVEQDILVLNTVGVNDIDGDEVRAWSAGGFITVNNPLAVDLHLHIHDATGRVVTTRRVPAQSGRIEIPTHGWTKGLYFLNASTPWEQWTFSLPVVE